MPYLLHLALLGLRKTPMLSGLMVLAIAIGIAASMTTLTVLHLLSGDPLPQKSAVLYYPQLDPRDINPHAKAGPPRKPPSQLTWTDAHNLLLAHRADREAMMFGTSLAVYPEAGGQGFIVNGRATTAQFFPMFAVPMRYGSGWNDSDDTARARVAVISSSLNDKLFKGANSVGKTLHTRGGDLLIAGVLDNWQPHPKFYDLAGPSHYGSGEDVFMPFDTARDLHLGFNGDINCWGPVTDIDHLETASCVWVQFWVELDSPARAAAYRDFLVSYSHEQKALGRFQREPNVRLHDLMGWLDVKKVVPGDVRLQVWLALAFLLVCLINTVGLMLASFLRRGREIGIRRALGAPRRAIFGQLLFEAATLGSFGGLLGLLLTLAGLWIVRQQPADYAALVHLDLPMTATTLLLAVVSTLCAALLPAWRACQVAPALQIKL